MTDPAPAGVSRETRARLGFVLGVLAAAVGVGWELGPGWGLVLAGLGVCVLCVFLTRVDDDTEDDQVLTDDQEWPGP